MTGALMKKVDRRYCFISIAFLRVFQYPEPRLVFIVFLKNFSYVIFTFNVIYMSGFNGREYAHLLSLQVW